MNSFCEFITCVVSGLIHFQVDFRCKSEWMSELHLVHHPPSPPTVSPQRLDDPLSTRQELLWWFQVREECCCTPQQMVF